MDRRSRRASKPEVPTSTGTGWIVEKNSTVNIGGKLRKARLEKRRYSIDLPRHMAVCDANFLRLAKLFPDMRDSAFAEFEVSPGEESVRVRLHVLERGPFTTIVGLTHLVGETPIRNGETPEPTFKIRVYHDARSAEVIEYQRQTRFAAVYDYPNPRMRQRDEKAQVNLFLGEVLAHCLRFGVASGSTLVTISG
jgi:uncharacterized protein YqiB (DUF1249 family)